MSRRVLTLVLALVMVLSTFSMAFAEVGGTITRTAAPVVTDVQGTEFEEAVTRLGILDIIKGYPDGTFKPSNTITRAEFAAVSVRAAGLGGLAGTTEGMPSGFNDVPNHHWASGFVGTAASLGIVNGIGHGLFAPDAQVTNEQAITMVVRALGYEPAAQAKGGYPFGYLIVANETGLIDGLEAPQGVPATRGFVSQITNNALEIPMMIQVGFGSSTKYVVSGEDGTKAIHLLDKLGLDSAEGVVEDYDAEDLEVVIDGETYDVEEGFDFYAVHGRNVTAWVADDVVVAVTVEGEVKFDAVEFKADETELTLVTEDKEYDLAEDRDDEIITEFILNDEVKDWEDDDFYADYAKVVFEDNDVRFVEGFNFDGFIVADEIDDEVILDINEDELDVEDYLIVKNGKTITVNDIKSNDVVFFSDEEYREYEGFAVVINKTTKGTVTRAYTDSFKLDGEDFELAPDAIYLDGEVLDYVDADILAGFEEEEGTITVYVNLLGEVVLMAGEVGDALTTVHGGILIADAKTFTNRAGWSVAWDLVNEEGKELELDGKTEETSVVKVADQWAVVEYEIDEDGDLEDVVVLEDFKTVTGAKVEIDDRYEDEGYRLNDKTVVFLVDLVDEEVDEVFTWADADEYFGEMVDYTVYYENGDAIYIVVTDSDAGGDFEVGKGVVVERRTLASSKVELTINIDGDEIEFDFKSSDVVGIAKGDFVEFMIDEETETIDEGTIAVISPSVTGLVDVVSQRNGEFKIDGNDYILDNNAVVFDTDLEEVRLDKADDKVVKVLFDFPSTTFVKYVLITDITVDELEAQAAKGAISLIPETVTLADEQIVVDARAVVDSLTVAQKALLTAAELAVLTDAEAAIVTLKAEADSAAEVQAVIDEIADLPATITLADESAVVAARASFDALTVDQQALVTNETDLLAAEERIAELEIVLNVESAVVYEYAPVYAYNYNAITVGSNSVELEYLMADLNAYNPADPYEAVMHDLARYLGALYRTSDNTVETIVYDGVEYTWDETLGLVGSNWAAADSTTLVSVITADFIAGTIIDSFSINLVDSSQVGIDVAFLLNVII